MKQLLTYSLLIFVLYAFNYKTIDYCLKYSGHISVCIQDYDCEKEDSEKPDEKNEKDEKKDLSEYLSLHKPYAITLIHNLSIAQRSKLLFIPSDHSKAVYSPPEQSLI